MRMTGRRFSIKTTNLAEVARLVQGRTKRYGFNVEERGAVEGEISLSATRAGSWHRFLRCWKLQRVDWTFRADDNTQTTVLTYDRRWFSWVRLLVVITAVPIACLWCFGFRSLLLFADESTHAAWVPLVMPWVGMFSMILFARCVLSIRDSLAYIDCVRDDLRAAGFMLDALPNAPLNRVTVSGLTLLGYAAIATVPVFLGVQIPTLHTKTAFHATLLVIIALLLVILVAFLVALFVGIRRYGADDRFAGVAPTLHAMMAVLFFSAGQMGPHLYGAATAKHWSDVTYVHALTRQANEEASEESLGIHTELVSARVQRTVVLRLWFPLGLLTASWLFAFGYALASVRMAAITQRICRRLQTDAVAASTRASTAGRGFLRIFRAAHGVIWFVYVAVTLVSLVPLVHVAVNAFGQPSAATAMDGSLGTIRGTSIALAVLLGLEPAEESLQLSVQLLFVVWAFVLPLLMCVSVLDLVRGNHRSRNRLKSGVYVGKTVTVCGEGFQWLAELRRRAGSRPPHLVLTESQELMARAHANSARSESPSVEISHGVVKLLSADELEALVAHEFAHHNCGHSQRRYVLQWIGRLTLVGDTFVGTFEDSFGYELEADRIAVTRLGVSPISLRNALLKMQVAMFVGSETNMYGGTTKAPTSRIGRVRNAVVGALSSWLALYRGDPPLSYWHPSLRERLEALDCLQETLVENQSTEVRNHDQK